MADKTSSLLGTWGRWQGLAIPDERIVSLNETESTYTENGPEPGTPEPQGDTDAVLRASGTQPVNGSSVPQEYDVFCNKAGMPGDDDTAAGIVWRFQGDSDYRGHDQPHVLAQWSPIEIVTGATNPPHSPHVITLPDGKLVMTYRRNKTIGGYVVETRTYDPSTETWASAVTVYSHGTAYGTGRDMHPCLMLLPSGRIQLYFWLQLSTGNMQIRMHYSDDGGATWSIGSRYCLPDALEYAAPVGGGTAYAEFSRIRAIEFLGDVMMVVGLKENNTAPGANTVVDGFIHYASSDVGATFTQVAQSGSADTADNLAGKHHELFVQNGGIVFLLPYASTTLATRLKMIRMGSVWESFKTAPSDTIAGNPALMSFTSLATSGSEIDDVDVTGCVDDADNIYIFMRDVDPGSAMECVVRRYTSYDSADSLGQSAYDSSFAPFWAAQDSSTFPDELSATWQAGTAVIVHQWNANPGNEDNSLGMMRLGRYSTATLPQYGAVFDTSAQVGAETTWLPFDLPSDCGWTGAGAGTGTLSNGRLEITTAANALTYSQTPSGTPAEGFIVWGSMSTQTGVTTSDQVTLKLVLDDTTEDYSITVRFGSAAVVVRDENGGGGSGTQIGSITVDTTGGIDFLIGFSSSGIEVYTRVRALDADFNWTGNVSSTSLTDGGGGAGGNSITFGHQTSVASSYWWMLAFQTDEFTGEQIIGRTYPQDLQPRVMSALPINLGNGLLISATDGPALYGDNWLIPARHQYPLTNALPWSRTISPRRSWRTLSGTQQTLTFDLDPALTAQSGHPNAAIVVGFFGCNWRTCTIYGRNAAGSYSSLAAVDAATGMDTLVWSRAGNTVSPGTPSSSDTPYLMYQECRRWSFEFDNGSVRKVLNNGEGTWRDSGKQARIIIDGADGSEGASGTAGALFPSDFAVIIPTSATHRSLRIVIDAQTTADGYIETGFITIGHLLVHGRIPSWGRTIDRARPLETTTLRDNTRRSRKVAPSSRRFTYAFTDWVDQSTSETDGNPDYIALASSGSPTGIASLSDTAYQIDGIIEGTNGGGRTLVYLPRIEVPSSLTAQVVNRAKDLALVVLDGDISIEESLYRAERVGSIPLLEIK